MKIVSPTEVVFEGEVELVVVPGSEGELGILANHAPVFSSLKEGKIRLRQKDKARAFDITGGFIEVLENKVTVLQAPQ